MVEVLVGLSGGGEVVDVVVVVGSEVVVEVEVD